MPKCPRCTAKLNKRICEGQKSYHCKRHGFVRNINSPTSTGMSDAEFDERRERGEFDHVKRPPPNPNRIIATKKKVDLTKALEDFV